MVKFLETWVVAIIVFFVLDLAIAIFGPIINNTFSPYVDNYIFLCQSGDPTKCPGLYSAKVLIVAFFNLFPYIMSCIILVWGFLVSSMKKENDDYYSN